MQQALIENDLRSRVKLRVDGGIKTGRDIIIGALLGAEEFGLGTALMIAEGCVMARQCHLNTCPVGITTQDKRLREKFPGTPEHIIKYLEFLATEVRQYLADMGYKSLDEIIGKTELLKPNIPQNHYKAKYIDVSEILKTAKLTEKPRKSIYEFNEIPPSKQPFDLEILKDVLPYIEKDENYAGFYVVKNTYRSIGTRIAHEIVKRYGDKGLRRGKNRA